jgi:hypothetical protein
MTQQLSPAAQAVLYNYGRALITKQYAESGRIEIAVAAALRAAADQVVPEKLESYGIRYELLRIADELEAQSSDPLVWNNNNN